MPLKRKNKVRIVNISSGHGLLKPFISEEIVVIIFFLRLRKVKEMDQEKFAFLKSLRVLFGRLLSGRIHFLKEYVGEVITMENGRGFRVIRYLKVDPKQKPEKSVAISKVCFKFSSLPLAVNKGLSLIPVPFLMARKGFHQKIWTVAEDGYFQGIYQWATKKFAEEYPKSFIFKMITKRSVEGTLSYEIIPDTFLSEYIESLLLN